MSAVDWTTVLGLESSLNDTDQLAQLFKCDTPSVEIIKNLKDNSGLCLLSRNAFNQITLVHNVTVLGPNLTFRDQTILGLSGAGSKAAAMRIHPESFGYEPVEIETPSWASLKSSNGDTLATLEPSGTSKVKLQGTIIVPPFIGHAILKSGSYDALELIPIVSSAMQAFDRDSEIKSCTNYRQVLFFLWAIHKGMLGHTIIMAVDESKDSLKWSSNTHLMSITAADRAQQGVPPGYPPTIPQQQVDARDDEEEEDKIPSNWKNIPQLIQQMVIKASSINEFSFPEGPSESLLKLMAIKKAVVARNTLTILLQNANCRINVPINLSTAIMNLDLRAQSSQVPHPFSCLNTPPNDSMANSEENIALALMASDGIGLDSATARSLVKDKLSVPQSTFQLRHHLNNWCGITQIVFGAQSLIATEMLKWTKHIDENERAYENQLFLDKYFGAKLCGQIDCSIHAFLGSCLKANNVDEVDWGLLNLCDKRASILSNTFFANLPAYLVSNQSTEEDVDRPRKKPKTDNGGYRNQEGNTGVTNTKLAKDISCSRDVYLKCFTRNACSKTPLFDPNMDLSACNR
jgi:hypothetical protein